MNTTITSGQMMKLLMLLKEQGVTPESFQIALKNGMMADHFKQVASLNDKLAELIVLAKFDWVNNNIVTQNFPVKKVPKLEGEKIFYFDRSISSKGAIAEMEKAGYRPATMAEGLVYAAKNPEEQRKYPIVLLGYVALIGNCHCAGILGERLSKRELDLCNFGDGWSGCGFLAVPK